MTRALPLLAAVLALAACGRAGDLEPAPGKPLPVKPKMALTQPTTDDLLKRAPITEPRRIDEILTKSEPRRPDPFDLPPPDGGPAPTLNQLAAPQ